MPINEAHARIDSYREAPERRALGWGRDFEDMPSRSPMGKRSSGQIWVSSSTARRFLTSRLGQSWDKVHSEICRRIPRIKQEGITSMVETKTCLVDGAPHYFTRFVTHRHGYENCVPITPDTFGTKRTGFYVCPRTKTLQFIKHKPYVRPEEPLTFIPHPKDKAAGYRRYDGIWYAVSLKPVESEALRYHLSELSGVVVVRGKDRFYVSIVKQLNGKELATLGVSNEPAKTR